MNSKLEPDRPPAPSSQDQQANPPLGPACLVLFVVFALFASVAVVIAAWRLMGHQPELAARSLEQQLIPWVQQSPLEATDRRDIVQQLEDVVSDLRAKALSERQLVRLKLRVTDCPVLQWGVIQQLQGMVARSGLTEQEKAQLERMCDRLLRAATEGKLAIQEMEFIVQNVSRKDRSSGMLTARTDVQESELRDFARRAAEVVERQQIPDEPFTKSVSQAFRQLLDDAMVVPK